MVLNNMIKKPLLGMARSQIKRFIKKGMLEKLPDDRVSFRGIDNKLEIQTTTEFADDIIGNTGRQQMMAVGIMPSDIANIVRQEFKEYDRKHKKGGK